MPNLHINNPCPESWDQMQPREQGRFCDKCCKVVIDFTSKTTTEILETIQSATGRVCGRIRAEELAPVPVFSKPMNRKRLFAMALFIVFGGLLFTSCRRHTPPIRQGDVRFYDWAQAQPHSAVKNAAGMPQKNH